MRNEIIFVLCIFIFAFGCSQHTDIESVNSVNPIIGDLSFINKFGEKPDQTTDENLRISTHLEYVEQLLRKKDVNHLAPAQQENRVKLLDLLHDYHTAGNFPKNYDFEDQRKPCFIDKDGNICAVGYLVEQTVGLEVAQQINSLFKYANIDDMKLPALTAWIAGSGLSLRECAMIQPAYQRDEPAYAVSSSLLSGVNIALMSLNGKQTNKSNQSNKVPVLGIISGAGQLTLGAIKFAQAQNTFNFGDTNESQKALSLINMGLGTSTLILSTYNLLSNRKAKKDKPTTFNFYSYPTTNNQMGLGLNLTRQF